MRAKQSVKLTYRNTNATGPSLTPLAQVGILYTGQPAAMNQEVAIDDQEPVEEESIDSSLYGALLNEITVLPPNSMASESRGYLSVHSKAKSKNIFSKDKNKAKSGKTNNESFDMAPRSSISQANMSVNMGKGSVSHRQRNIFA